MREHAIKERSETLCEQMGPEAEQGSKHRKTGAFGRRTEFAPQCPAFRIDWQELDNEIERSCRT